MVDIEYNRIKNGVEVLCVLRKANPEKSRGLRRYAKNNLHLGDLDGKFIDAIHILFDDWGYNSRFDRLSDALLNGIISEEDIKACECNGAEFLAIYPVKLMKLLESHPRLVPELEKYMQIFDYVYVPSISNEYTQNVLNNLKLICASSTEKQKKLVELEQNDTTEIVHNIKMTQSIEDDCKVGFITRKRLYDLLNEYQPELLNKDRCKKHNNPVYDAELIVTKDNGTLIIHLW